MRRQHTPQERKKKGSRHAAHVALLSQCARYSVKYKALDKNENIPNHLFDKNGQRRRVPSRRLPTSADTCYGRRGLRPHRSPCPLFSNQETKQTHTENIYNNSSKQHAPRKSVFHNTRPVVVKSATPPHPPTRNVLFFGPRSDVPEICRWRYICRYNADFINFITRTVFFFNAVTYVCRESSMYRVTAFNHVRSLHGKNS